MIVGTYVVHVARELQYELWMNFSSEIVFLVCLCYFPQTQVKNVKLVGFGGARVSGVVKSLRDGGFGFIRPLGGTEDVYFRINDTCK